MNAGVDALRLAIGRVRAWAGRGVFMTWRDTGLFLQSARTDAMLRMLTAAHGNRAAFEAVYREAADPWASGSTQYRYQGRKYDGIMARLPPQRRFGAALDLGSGLGLLCTRLAVCADTVLGVDLAQSALDRASVRTRELPQISYRQGDVAALPADLDGRFDLITIVDTLYYLPKPITDLLLASIVARVTQLLAAGGIILLANHYVFAGDPDSRLTRRIHRAFAESPRLTRISEARRPFYLVDLLVAAGEAS